MKISYKALCHLVKEGIDKPGRLVKERPWSVEYSFKLSGGIAHDSEGLGPDGFAIVMSGESGMTVSVVVDTYWNPQNGDESGNQLNIEIMGILDKNNSTYVPTRFDDGKKQFLVISNAPVPGLIIVSHGVDDKPPVAYCVFQNPFEIDESVDFEIQKNGNGKADVKFSRSINL